MKRSIIGLAAVLCVGVPGAAVAGDVTPSPAELYNQVHELQQRLAHKSDVLACERQNRRVLERALRTGGTVFVKSCR